MKPIPFALLTLLVLTGCQSDDRDAAMAQGEAAMAHGEAALTKVKGIAKTAWLSASQEAQRLSTDSSRAAIESARQKLAEAQAELANLKMPSKVDALRIANLEEQAARLEAALDVQKLREQLDAKVQQAMATKQNVEQTADDVKNRLAEADRTYQDLRKQLDQAQREYDSAAQRVDDIRQKLGELGGVQP
jgi:chromosome segregation ATPase